MYLLVPLRFLMVKEFTKVLIFIKVDSVFINIFILFNRAQKKEAGSKEITIIRRGKYQATGGGASLTTGYPNLAFQALTHDPLSFFLFNFSWG